MPGRFPIVQLAGLGEVLPVLLVGLIGVDPVRVLLEPLLEPVGARDERQDDATRKYRLGPRILDLGFSMLGSLGLREIAAPHLRRLTDATGTHRISRSATTPT